jgi:queuine tRNA-ribosyltransferase
MGWPHPILTDSGGYQIFSLRSLMRIDDEGVAFRSHIDGSAHVLSPEKAMAVQAALGADIAMVLDQCPPSGAPRAHIEEALERTTRWARRCVDQPRPAHQARFGIIQGGLEVDLRLRHLEELGAMPFDGYALGGLSVGEPRTVSFEMVEATEDILPRDRPRYCMGVGMLEELGQYVAGGVDMMDCVLPTRNARNGYLFTNQGRLMIKHRKYRDDPRPVDEKCPCSTCARYSRAYLRHLFLSGEILFSTLATCHNLFTYLDRMRRIRLSIMVGNLPNLLNSFSLQRMDEE